jgi:hypothetical protein
MKKNKNVLIIKMYSTVQEQIKKEPSYERRQDDDTNSNSYELSDEAVARLDEIDTEIEEDYEDDFEEHESFYFKYCFENCTNISQIIIRLEEIKAIFEEYQRNGYELISPVDSGYCFIDKISTTDA